MPIQRAGSAKGADTTSAGSSFNLTISSGLNLISYVGVGHLGANDADLTGVTVGGVAATKIVSIQRSDLVAWVSLWQLIAPASGVVSVAVTLNASIRHIVMAAAYMGALQTSQPDGSDSDNAGAPVALSVTTTIDNDWGIVFGQGAGINAGTNVNTLESEASFGSLIGDSNGPITPAGAFGMNLNQCSAGVMIAFKPEPFDPTRMMLVF